MAKLDGREVDGDVKSSAFTVLIRNTRARSSISTKRQPRRCLLIEPYGYRWYRVGGLDYLLRCSDIEQQASS